MDQSISVLSVFFSSFYQSSNRTFCKQNSGDSDQTKRSAASDQGLHCLSVSHKKDARLIWVNAAFNLGL